MEIKRNLLVGLLGLEHGLGFKVKLNAEENTTLLTYQVSTQPKESQLEKAVNWLFNTALVDKRVEMVLKDHLQLMDYHSVTLDPMSEKITITFKDKPLGHVLSDMDVFLDSVETNTEEGGSYCLQFGQVFDSFIGE